MKLSDDGKKVAPRTLPKQHVLDSRVLAEHIDDPQQEIATNSDTAFLILMAKDAGLQRKDFQYGMSVSKELVKLWFEGTRHSPLKRARDCVALFPARLVPTLLEYIAGSNFDGSILSAEQQQALMVLAKVLTK